MRGIFLSGLRLPRSLDEEVYDLLRAVKGEGHMRAKNSSSYPETNYELHRWESRKDTLPAHAGHNRRGNINISFAGAGVTSC